MPRDYRHTAPAEPPASTEGQRPCSRGIWCSARTVTVVDGERVTNPAMGYQQFCIKDEALIRGCLRDLPGLWLRLQYELAEPVTADTSIHVPFGPSIPVRLDVDAAMRMTAFLLAAWASRVRHTARLTIQNPFAPVLSARAVKDAADTLARNTSTLLALQPDYMTFNARLHPGRHGQPASISPELLEEHGDTEIVRVGADFIGLWVQRDGAAAGLEILHLHFWCRSVLRETPARPDELLGVECRSPDCSALALRRAEPAWHSGDPDYFSECAICGDLQTEEEYRLWTGQLHAYHAARIAAMPVLGQVPVG